MVRRGQVLPLTWWLSGSWQQLLSAYYCNARYLTSAVVSIAINLGTKMEACNLRSMIVRQLKDLHLQVDKGSCCKGIWIVCCKMRKPGSNRGSSRGWSWWSRLEWRWSRVGVGRTEVEAGLKRSHSILCIPVQPGDTAYGSVYSAVQSAWWKVEATHQTTKQKNTKTRIRT